MSIVQAGTLIVQTLNNAGFEAFFVGGCVRDKLMGETIHDIDIATNASPTMIATLFPDTLTIGAKFGIIVVKLHGFLFEVATFRSEQGYADGRHPDQVTFSSMKEDALRRDFTMNALYYHPITDKVFDLVDGQFDLQRKILRAIGVPRQRFIEDRLRILRAIRFAASLGFTIEPKTEAALLKEKHALTQCISPERIWQELKKMLLSNPVASLNLLIRLKVLPEIFPELLQTPHYLLKQRARAAAMIQDDVPEIMFLLPLFRDIPEQATIAAFQRLKISNAELKLIEMWYHATQHIPSPSNHYIFWTRLLSSPLADPILVTYTATLPEQQQAPFLNRLQQLHHQLAPFIMRIQRNMPLVQAADLINKGIAPGKLLGDLLKEAENLSIELQCNDKETILNILQKKGFWK